jgi:hypothetical protein
MNSAVYLGIAFAVPTLACGIRGWFEWRQHRPDKVWFMVRLWLVVVATFILGFLFLPTLMRGPTLLGHSEAVERLRMALAIWNVIFAVAVLGVLAIYHFSTNRMGRLKPYFLTAQVVLTISLLVTVFIVNR